MRTKSVVLFLIVVAITQTLLITNCLSKEKPVIHFGIGLRYHPIVVYERFQPMMDYLTQNTPYKFELKISRDYKEALKFLAEGITDVSAIGDGGLIKAMLLYGAVPIVKPLNDEGRPFYRCYFIVPVNSPLHSLKDLKGKKVAFGSHHSTSGNLIPRSMLLKSGIRIEDLGSLKNLRNHSTVTTAVLKGEFDAGAVRDTVAKRYDNHGLRVLAYSDEIPSIPLVARKDAPKELIKAITDALVKLDPRNSAHQKIMENWDTEYKYGFVPATAADYRELIRRFKATPNGCSTGCHR